MSFAWSQAAMRLRSIEIRIGSMRVQRASESPLFDAASLRHEEHAYRRLLRDLRDAATQALDAEESEDGE